MLAAVDAYSISVFLHIAAVVVGFGSTYALAITFPVAMAMDKRYLPYVHALGMRINQWLATPALVIILVTGLYQVSDADLSLGDAWISVPFAILIVLGGLIGAVFLPTERRMLEMAERDLAAGGAEMSDEYNAAARRSAMFGMLAGVLILVAIFFMTTKPGA